MAGEVQDRPDLGPDDVVGPSWEQCPPEWRREPEPVETTHETAQARLFDRFRVPAAMVLSAAAGYPVGEKV